MTDLALAVTVALLLILLVIGARRLRGATVKLRAESHAVRKQQAANEKITQTAERTEATDEREMTSIPHAPSLPMHAETRVLRWVSGESPPLFSVVPNPIATHYSGAIQLLRTERGTYVCQTLPTPNGKDYHFYPLEDVPLSEEEIRRAEMRAATVVITLQNGAVIEAQVPRHDRARNRMWEYDLSRGREGMGR